MVRRYHAKAAAWQPRTAFWPVGTRMYRASTLPALPFPQRSAGRTLPPVDMPDSSDETLMLAWVAGDAGAFEQLYGRHRLKLYRYLLRHLRDNGLTDELFQDVWQKVIAARGGWTPEASFASWLYAIAHHRLGDHWRSRKHRPSAPDDADERLARLADPNTPERVLSDFERRRQLQLALDDLPDEQRNVLLLRLEQELSLEEIGAVTGAGRETVKSRLRYAMDKLRARLSP